MVHSSPCAQIGRNAGRMRRAMRSEDAKGVAHYPGWSKEVLKYLYENRKITASGHETTDTDPGIATSKGGLFSGNLHLWHRSLSDRVAGEPGQSARGRGHCRLSLHFRSPRADRASRPGCSPLCRKDGRCVASSDSTWLSDQAASSRRRCPRYLCSRPASPRPAPPFSPCTPDRLPRPLDGCSRPPKRHRPCICRPGSHHPCSVPDGASARR